MAGEGFEPSKAEPGDLQSPPIGRSGNPPGLSVKQPANSSEGLALGRGTYLLDERVAWFISRISTTWYLDRQDRLLPSASNNADVLTLYLD